MRFAAMRTFAITISVMFISAITTCIHAQEHESSAASEHLAPEVPLFEQTPVIDGILDADLNELAVRQFHAPIIMGNDNEHIEAVYRLAYSYDYLYLHIETNADSIICRDRGYQNGDGFLLLISAPTTNAGMPSQYYLLALNPTENPEQPVERMVWGKNGEWPFSPLSADSQFATAASARKTGFELLLSWDDIYPFHPLTSPGIGFNLFFSKATGDTGMNIYGVVMDESLLPEENLFLSATIDFMMNTEKAMGTTFLTAARNCSSGDSLSLSIAIQNGKPGNRDIACNIVGADNSTKQTYSLSLTHDGTLTRSTHSLAIPNIEPGTYTLVWRSPEDDCGGEIPLTILPDFRYQAILDKIDGSKTHLTAGDYHSLRFLFEKLSQQVMKIDPYEAQPKIADEMVQFLEMLDNAASGNAVFEARGAIIRRAFRSRIDDTLQPYSIRMPVSYDPKRRYPMVVFLHGSDVDDTSLATHIHYLQSEEYIVMAPYGRGSRHAYSNEDAQRDICEAIEDASSCYSIDKDRIIIAGFSMGGYGAYRTFYEHPECYCGIAIIAGHPNVANEYFPDETHPDFTNLQYLDTFAGVPMFVFQGGKDRNAPYELTNLTIDGLKSVGADVEYRVENDAGHQGPNPRTTSLFHEWVSNLIQAR